MKKQKVRQVITYTIRDKNGNVKKTITKVLDERANIGIPTSKTKNPS